MSVQIKRLINSNRSFYTLNTTECISEIHSLFSEIALGVEIVLIQSIEKNINFDNSSIQKLVTSTLLALCV